MANDFKVRFYSGIGARGPQGPKGDKGDTGDTGARGPRGYHFTPDVSTNGDLTWTNDGGLTNPDPVNLTNKFVNTVEAARTSVQALDSDVASLQADAADLSSVIAQAQNAVDGIEAQRDEIMQSIADAAELGTDTTLSTSGMAADAKAAGLVISAVDTMSERALNRLGYESLTWEQGGINDTTGLETTNAKAIRTVGYFDITDVYNVVVQIPAGYRFRIYRYDDNGVFKNASSSITTTTTTIYTRTSSGTKYRFFFAENATPARDICPKEGALFSLRAYQDPSSILKLSSAATPAEYLDTTVLLPKVEGVTKFPGNLFDPTNALNDYYIKWETGERKSLSGYYATGYIPVVAGTTYRANYGRNLSWYDSAYNFVSGVQGTSIQESGVTAPAGAAYIRFSISKSGDTTNLFDVYFAAAADYDPIVRIPGLVAEPVPWCYGKTINWIGDSIVDGPDFDERVCAALGLTKLTTDGDGGNGGINGSTIALNGNGTNTRHALCARYADMPANADIIAVSCGTNDFQYAWSPIGTINAKDNGDDDTYFYGALKHLCKGLIDRYPGKLIFFTTPIKRMQPFTNGNGGDNTLDYVATTPFSKNKYGLTLGDYADIIKEVCGLYSIPVLDMYRESMLNPHIASQQQFFDKEPTGRSGEGEAQYFYTHPNAAGQKIMARRVAGWLTQLGYNIT